MCVRVFVCIYIYILYLLSCYNIIKFNMQIAFKPSIFHNFNSVTPYDELLGENEWTNRTFIYIIFPSRENILFKAAA